MTRTVRFNIVDVFTDVPMAGNQLAVFTDARGLTTGQMQALANEMHFSESTFVTPPEGGGNARIRIFTPARELPFAGHPVLGTAFVLGGPMQLGRIVLETAGGDIPVWLDRDGAKLTFGRMEQPIPTWEPFARERDLLAALGVERSELPVEVYDNGIRHVFVVVPSAADVAAVRPDLAAIAELADGINVLCADGARAKTRNFDPAMGVAEDAATGSAAGPLAVHLARHAIVAWGERVEISQGAEIGRPSTLYATAEGGADGVTRLEVAGSAVVVGRGELQI
jgi:trans-2,3-dihydro-3-hydroxyanthranilate isomerase